MAQCLTPFYKNDQITGKYMAFPCGQCPECLKRRVSGWSFRLTREGRRSSSAYFLTLTYENPPMSKNGFMSLQKTDVQKFIKRLRKTNGNKLKYYACGEYGSQTHRPHYHIILFNAFESTIEKAWSINNKPIGHVHTGDVNEASIGYTLKYMCKTKKVPMHKNDDRQKEWSIMSKGLGANYLTKEMRQWHKNDIENRMYCPLEEGKKIAMPRYYKQKIYTEEERKTIGNYMAIKMGEEVEKEILKHGDNYEQNRVNTTTEKFRRLTKQRINEKL